MTAVTRSQVVSALTAAAYALVPEVSTPGRRAAGSDAELRALDREHRQALKQFNRMVHSEPALRRSERHAAWDREFAAAAAALDDVEMRIAAVPAESIVGLAVKLRVAQRELLPASWGPENTQTLALRAAIADAERLAG